MHIGAGNRVRLNGDIIIIIIIQVIKYRFNDIVNIFRIIMITYVCIIVKPIINLLSGFFKALFNISPFGKWENIAVV